MSKFFQAEELAMCPCATSADFLAESNFSIDLLERFPEVLRARKMPINEIKISMMISAGSQCVSALAPVTLVIPGLETEASTSGRLQTSPAQKCPPGTLGIFEIQPATDINGSTNPCLGSISVSLLSMWQRGGACPFQ